MATNNGGTYAGRILNGRYQLIGIVGGGGMAQVYKARDNVLGRLVAIKVLRDQYASDDQFVARFRREAQAAANLAHPNVVNVYDVGQDGDLHYIVMEFVSGQSLKDLINRSAPLPIDRAVSIAAQILAGLEFAHRSGLIHRDIKPQNVLITPDGTVKVTDFGIAKSVSDLGLTEAGMALGTAHYFSPEQAKGERVVPQSDIYAVGVTLYEMLTGRLPFESDSIVGLAYKHINEEAPSPRELNPSVPPRLEAIVRKALSKDPVARFGSATEMEKALRNMQAGGQQMTMEVPVAHPTVTQAGPRPAQRPPARTGRSGQTTGPIRVGGAYPAGAAAGAAAAGAATRQITGALGAPSSVAIRPTRVRVQSSGGSCAAVGVALVVLGVLAIIVVAGIWIGPQLPGILSNPIVPSPTPSPTVPTATPTNTPTYTPTSTPTNTPTSTPTPKSAPVPQLVGLKIQDATTLAKQAGFVLVQLDRIDSQYPEGVVAQQDPPANTVFQQTRQIAVRVSNGPPQFKLPQVANTNPDDARTVLEGAGLKVTLAYEGSTTVPKGVVIRSEPPGDSSIRPGDSVKLVVSLGEVSEVPDLHGITDVNLAQQRLESVGLTLGNVTEIDDPTESVPPGAVYSQNPPKGTIVSKGSPVDIQIRRKTP